MTKKFYQSANIQKNDSGFGILLDDKSLKTPKGSLFVVTDERLASAIADEWNDVVDTIDPLKMPVTQICMTSADFHDEKYDEWRKDILAYIDNDALCFWTGEIDVIHTRQKNQIGPVLNSIQKKTGLPVKTTEKLEIISQDNRWQPYLLDHLHTLNPVAFTNFYLTTIECGSVFLAYALQHGLISAEDVYNIIFLEEQYKAEIYKEDFYGIAPDLERKQNGIRHFLTAAQKVFQSL